MEDWDTTKYIGYVLFNVLKNGKYPLKFSSEKDKI
jgi:hypothetical protein